MLDRLFDHLVDAHEHARPNGEDEHIRAVLPPEAMLPENPPIQIFKTSGQGRGCGLARL
jgi:hypothetical protein